MTYGVFTSLPKQYCLMDSTTTKKLRTEDTGKILEKAICLVYNIEYSGNYKYSEDAAVKMKGGLTELPELFPPCIHTANRGARYDFTAKDNETKHLSAKSTKKGVGKVAPQVIGQAQPKKFCEVLNIPFTTNEALKEYIQTHIKEILPIIISYTFDCDVIHYHEEKKIFRYITMVSPIDWEPYSFTWTCSYDQWKNSSTLKIIKKEQEIPLLEFQFHTKSRTNMAVRWCFENILNLFPENLHSKLLSQGKTNIL